MVSWVCKEIGYPRRLLSKIEFGNRQNTAWSGRAWPRGGEILVRIGPDNQFPAEARIHWDGFSIGQIHDRLDALVKVTAHEIAHCDNARRRNKSRRGKGTGGSERYTDLITKQVLDAFRSQREQLVEAWTPLPVTLPSSKQTVVQKRAKNAYRKEKEWEAKRKQAETYLKKWRKKANYYRRVCSEKEELLRADRAIAADHPKGDEK